MGISSQEWRARGIDTSIIYILLSLLYNESAELNG